MNSVEMNERIKFTLNSVLELNVSREDISFPKFINPYNSKFCQTMSRIYFFKQSYHKEINHTLNTKD